MKYLLLLFFFSCSSLKKEENCLGKIAGFDVGSGSTKMKVYEVNKCERKILKLACEDNRAISYKEDFYKGEKRSLSQDIQKQGLKALMELKEKAKNCGATEFYGVATSVFRQAYNGGRAIKELSQKSGVDIGIITQEKEAMLGFYGGVSKLKNVPKSFCVWDIGGSSMQIVCHENGNKKMFLGHLASVPFKEKVIELQKRKSNTPNPISKEDYQKSFAITKDEADHIKETLGDALKRNRVIGIGGVHYYALSVELQKKTYTADDINQEILKRLNKTNFELGDGKYVNTSVSNMLLVEGLMRSLEINKVQAFNVNLTEGLVQERLSE